MFDENVHDDASFEQKSTKPIKSFTEKRVKPQGGHPQVNHALTLDMAKELSMIQRTGRGKQRLLNTVRRRLKEIKMKTKDFIRKMNEVASTAIDILNTGINIYNLDGKTAGWVSIDDFGTVDTSYKNLDTMKNKEEVVKLLFEYALTPLDEREDELKFRVRMLPGDDDNCEIYLNLGKRSKDIFLDESDETDKIQTIFTKSEYEKLQQKYSEWLPKFDEKDPHFEFLEADK